MRYVQRVGAALLVASAVTPGVRAQAPLAPELVAQDPLAQAAAAQIAAAQAAARANLGPVPAPRRIAPTQVPAFRRSVVHHNPYPYPNYYENDADGRLPQSRRGRAASRVLSARTTSSRSTASATRPSSPSSTRAAAHRTAPSSCRPSRLGIAKYNSIQGSIDNYARPAFGFGYGVGGFGGFY